MTEQTARCVIGTREHAADIGYLCTGHYESLRGTLRDIEDQVTILSAVPSMQQRNGSGSRSPASTRTPAKLDVIALRDPRTRPAGARPPGPACPECWHGSCIDIRAWLDAYDAGAVDSLSVLDVLHSWARVVREDRDLDTPLEAVTVSGERDLLDRHLPWIAEQEWVDECCGDLRKLAAQLKACNGTADDKPVGRCYLPADDGPCNGPIWVDLPMGSAHCGRCRATWDGYQLTMLSFELEQARREAVRPKTTDGRRMLTAQELVDAGHVSSVSNVRVIAHRRRIVSVDGHYDPADFDTTTNGGASLCG